MNARKSEKTMKMSKKLYCQSTKLVSNHTINKFFSNWILLHFTMFSLEEPFVCTLNKELSPKMRIKKLYYRLEIYYSGFYFNLQLICVSTFCGIGEFSTPLGSYVANVYASSGEMYTLYTLGARFSCKWIC